ncbi:uncharacterized protein FIBRA_00693 [Fibroporia radiculosa]|uniref:F-box domain-containing protein n=1 Tax=Fibroporia radiculosa TaxID=599839 RepID=J4GID3_9APHY|nr:uncharacterized protein FIBRA_00693 [Fibroporia radiculosa]CCL98690.1 predicted protein [Fibroporia radiculosa]
MASPSPDAPPDDHAVPHPLPDHDERPTLCDLPFDVFFELLNYVSATEITFLLSTCRTLHRYVHQVSIWQRLCARYGLRTTHGRSFFTTYTQLLHPYGPLLGIWASDHPYYGNIVEFRLLPDDQNAPGGIVGEVWRFPTRQFDGKAPSFPEYSRVLNISFSSDSPLPGANEECATPVVTSVCCGAPNPARITKDNTDIPLHSASIEIVSPSPHAYFLQEYRRTYMHPEFPAEAADWYDTERELPHVPKSTIAIQDQRQLVNIYPAVRLPLIFTSITARTKPAAISIRCHVAGCESLQMPLPFDDMITAPPRYYPLRRDTQEGIDPDDAEWSLQSLTGLWLGDYGRSGTECLHVTWRQDLDELRAYKLTGDAHVPRGVCTWTVMSQPAEMSSAALQNSHAVARAFRGVGTISLRGFPAATAVELVVGIVGANEIRIWWDQVNDWRTYVRYTGRDHIS